VYAEKVPFHCPFFLLGFGFNYPLKAFTTLYKGLTCEVMFSLIWLAPFHQVNLNIIPIGQEKDHRLTAL
jgi:hypothetical protein